MSNKVPPDLSGEWGEDIYSLATAEAIGDTHLARRMEESISAKYRHEIRSRFETDEAVRQFLAEATDPTVVADEVADLISSAVRPGTEQIFKKVLKETLSELKTLMKADPSLYLVDEKTGKVVMPLRAGAIYQPPPYVDDNGVTHKSKPILHPGIAAPLAEAKVSQDRTALALENPSHAYDHLRAPNAIRDRAMEVLGQMGYKPLPDSTGPEWTECQILTFGKEYYEGVLQSPNPMFHRVEAFGGALGRQIARFLDEKDVDRYSLGAVIEKSNAKFRWYEINVYYG